MINLEEYLYGKAKSIMEKWNGENIYAVSFYVYANLANSYGPFNNVPEFSVSYNTEEDYENAKSRPFFPPMSASEARWNFAFWRQNMAYIINPNESDGEGIKVLFEWYKENGIENVGAENSANDYDNGRYVGKGPVGYYELLTAVSNAARRLQAEGFIAERFGAGKRIPVIVHQLEYCWYVEEATENANPNGEAEEFLKAVRNFFS